MEADGVSALARIQEALSTIQQALDRLTASGHDEAAFEIARAQFAASMRASWPANLSGLAATLDRVLGDVALPLSDKERAELKSAADVLRSVAHP